jgi:hypothetical protein
MDWSLVGACRGLMGLFAFGCISAKKRENAIVAEVRNSHSLGSHSDLIGACVNLKLLWQSSHRLKVAKRVQLGPLLATWCSPL